MIDFIEYVVAELKSKRLSKDHAVSLVRQFSRRAPGPATGSVLHPLLHVNTSDLGEQRYSSHFGGDEFFLADHRVRSGEGERRVLPGVAYLEMVRAAMAQAVSERPEATALELRNTVWAQPVIAEGATRVHVALIPGDGDAIDYEIYSGVGEAEIIHGQGVATFAPIDAGDAPSLELDALRARMGRGGLAADALYAHCARMGLLYGPRMRAVTGIERGEDELLARLALPADVESDVYVLHPSLMDGALQAAVGLLDDAGDTPWLPFALDRLRVLAPCVAEMFAWVRYAPGSGAGESVIRLDIDLCDATGAVRAQLRGFSSRALVRGEGPARADAVVAASVAAPSERSSAAPVPVREGLLLASPSWVVEAVADDAEAQAFAGHHVVLCELPNADAAELAATLDGASCTAMPMAGGDIAWRYRALALACFDRIKALLASRPQGRILFRIVVPDDGDGGETALFAGLSGLLRTAALENPQFVGQLIRVPAGIATDALAKLLRRDAGRPDEAEIRYRGDVRAVARWQEIEPATSTVPSAWRDGGVYLITGGLGGLGRLFAQDILGRARGATVVLAGRGALDARREAALRSLSVGDGRACYRPVDLEDAASVDALVASILAEHGRLDGVLHAAGTTADGFLLRKTDDEFARVLGPKVLGTRHLDHATRTVDLDCFVLFSAVAGAMGNLGQADYAAANAFMDAYALHRNALVAAGARRGRTVAIDWPLWQDGGMAVDAAAQERLHAMSGMRPMRGEIGLQAFDRALERARDALQTPEAGRLLAMEGDLARMRATFFGASRETVDADASTDERADTDIPNREDDAVETDAIETAADDLAERTADWLRREFAGLLKLPVESIESRAALEEYGIDSILVMRLTNRLEETFGSLPKTLFFEYQTLHDLAGYFVAQHARALRKLFAGRSVKPAATVVSAPRVAALQASSAPVGRSARRRRRFGGIDEPASLSGSKRDEPIAIVGLSGRYPEAIDIAAFWRNLRDGRDCIVEVPEERWDWRRWYSEDRTASGRHFSKWGGFIAGVDEFDPLFFNISPREAELIDPQERLFLQHAWMAVEDAGYTRDGLRVPEEHDLPGQVGVYVGLMYTEYQLFGPELTARGEPTGIAVSASSIANRVSYALNLHGPSMTVDTMCSSSLTAIHLACQDLQAGRTRFAIAGGVNVSIHPSKYLILSSGQFISSDGHCQSFGEGGDGYIPGEGVGVVVLKRLSDAERDGDRIYGLIRGSALNHGGKTNGYTVPNPQAQAAVIGRALAEAGIDARRIGYVEAHGTGTKLGDPIEIAALGKAFAKYTDATGFCPIGSAKSNIGHCESAAGIAGLTKVLLQLKHRQIVPSLHSARLNPHIDFEKTPFVVNQTLREWPAPEVDGRTWPRLAGLSSFGAGGSNAHLLVEEYVAPETVPVAHAQVAVVLSARTSEQLRQKASDLLAFVGEHPEADLTAMGYTLQVGREAMDERVGWVVSTVSELSARLAAFAADGEALEDGYRGQARRNREALSLFGSDGDLREAVEKWIAGGKLGRLVELWTKGLEVDWRLLYGSGRPRRMALPTYPFAKERYWVDLSALRGEGPGDVRTATLLHPLLHENTSDLDAQRYTSVFDGEEFFLADHRIRGADGASLRVLPGVAYLEMARAAVAQALPQRPHDAALELRNTVWAQPAIVDGATRVHIALSPNDDGGIDYDIHGDVAEEHADREAAPIHCQGTVRFDDALSERLDPVALRARMGRDRIDAEALYATCARMGLLYGPRFRGVVALHRGEGEVLAELRLPAGAAREGFVLHPSLMDSALQAAVGLIEGGAEQSRLPFALERLRVVAPCVPEMQAWIRYAEGSGPRDAVVKLDIDLCDAHGNVCVQMHGFSWRFASLSAMSIPMQSQDARQAPAGLLLAVPAWEPVAPAAPAQAEPAHAHRPTLLCELPKVDPRRLSVALGGDECVALSAMPNAPVAERYRHHAVACFERIKALLERRLEGRTLLRVVVPDEGEQAVFAGLSGLLKTASLENPLLTTQLVRVPAQIASKALAERLQQATLLAHEPVLRFRGERCEAPRWREAPADVEPMPDYAANGVYLITGGLGALGLLFARDILDRAPGAHVVLGGRSVLTEERRPLLEALAGDRGRASYRQIDLEDAADVARAVSAIVAERGRLDGVLHSAGMIADNFILKKSVEEFGRVLAPKVLGTAHLDAATRDLDLELFALFSSMAGPLGNPGQADYAAANAFLDAFAEHRAAEVAAGRRRGRTLSIDWPLWESGGMAIERVAQEVLESSTGLRPMRTATGLRAFRRMLALDAAGAMAIEGDVPRMRRRLLGAPAPAVDAAPAREDAAPDGSMQGRLLERTRDYLREEFSGILKLAAHRIDPDAALEQYGIDSVLAMRLTNQLERTFGSLSKTLFFEYQTIAALAGYLVKAHSDALTRRLGVDGESAPPPSERAFLPEPVRAVRASARGRFAAARPAPVREVAIVGLAGRYPQAENVDEFWRNLKLGRDCIGEVPPERWDHARYFDPDPNKPGKTYSKWGGFLDDIDRFDPLFFNISPKEAELTDPQERLFLETVWQAIEDAGYSRDGIASRRVGVYVGVMWGQYELYGAESVLRGNTAVPTSSHASVANRISYYFDFRGPSLAIDTMCSSSLTAIHLACEELRRGEIEAAIAGGVNLTSHPYKYLTLSQGKFMATDGRCRSFGRGGDGYVPGEGVGAIVLKPLDRALRDGDQVYAVIRATAVNHGGKTNGYSVPNPNAQAELIADACRRGGVDPKTLGYIETHGTGTALGDPIEITGLTKAFEGATDEKQFCPIGSVKSNIGHLEAAAGIAAVTKALLQLKHRQLAPSLHADPLNPNISFENTPFRVQTELADWKRIAGQPRRVGVSSFGAGGANAHVILEEFGVEDPVVYDPAVVGSQEAFLLSARDHEALRRYATRMIARLREAAPPALEEIAFTSQVGRTPMPVRLVVVADSVATLADRLSQWLALQPSGDGRSGAGAHELADVYHGSIREFHYGAGDLIDGRAGDAFLDDLLSARDLPKLARLWIMGVDIDWSRLRRGARPKRVSLPTYPFARERYWIEAETPLSSPRPIELRKAEGRRGDARKSARAASATVAESRQRMYCRPYWAPTPLETPPPSESTGPILVLDTSDALFLALRARLGETAAARMALVVPGDGFARTADGTYTVDPTREQDFHALVERLAADRLLPALVVHRGCDAADDGRDAVERGLATGVYALFHLCKALMTQKQATSLKLLSAFAAGGAATPPLAPAIAGFLKTLTLENPGYRAKAVEIDGVGGEPSDEEMAAAILRELQEPAWTANEVRYVRDSGSEPMRLTGELVPFVPASPGGTLPMRDGATYVITGGLGGLGLIFAEYLARKHRAKLVLTGRSSRGQKQAEAIARLESHGAEVLFVQGDVSLAEDAARIVREAKVRFGAIHGVIHSAGANRDAFLLKKDVADFAAVLAPKVHGALALDLATREEPLELFALFASVAGAIGNPGQCDYAYGNHFLDAFAQRRETLRRSGLRAGRTVAIDWPLWEEGGMGLSPEEIRRQEAQVGASPLPTAEGLRCWEDALRADAAQIVVLYGLPSRMSGSIARKSAKGGAGAATRVADVDPAILFGKIEDYLKAMVGREIKLAPERIAASERFESFGVDSVMIGKFNAELERDLGVLPKTLFYEYETIEELAKYLQQYARDALVALFGLSGGTLEAPAEPLPHEVGFDVDDHDPHADEAFDEPERFAIIGIHGRYPHAANLDEFWENLRLGRDATGAVPTVRWNSEALYDPDPAASADGRIYCRSGGFLDDVDRFDAAFFNIPADEAKIADPQERLFLESVWAAVEDAGYTREGMRRMFPKGKGADVGVFVGVTTNSYHLLAAQAHAQGAAVHASAMPWSIANRVSYVFDFNGPSMPIDTACSSSLVAVHLACESLRHGECRLAIAGGVNLYLHPAKYQSLCHRRMLALEGKCRSYGAGDDGFVPGEGVGSVLLKPLSRAIADRDRIYAVVSGSAYDHSGRSNGYSAPNPNAQAHLIATALAKARIHPESISCIEGHGTGTQLGDSLEVAAMTQAFRRQTDKKQYCPMGSVKANIGHSESAAGMAGLAKVLLQIRHRQLAPTIHCDPVNPDIDFADSPFHLQRTLTDWNRLPMYPRRALINSFGAGGVNACVIVEEYEKPQFAEDSRLPGPYLFVLSARNEARLRDYVERLLVRLRSDRADRTIDPADLCYTLQVGREAMEERLSAVVNDIPDLVGRLEAWIRRGDAAGLHRGSAGPRRGGKRPLTLAMGERDLAELALMWAAGEDVDWDSLYPGETPHRIGLPTYPFARDRHWVAEPSAPSTPAPSEAVAQLHPLIGYNASTLRETAFASTLPDSAFYAREHMVAGERIFPGAGFLEMACVAGTIAGERRVRSLRDIVWAQPLGFRRGAQHVRTSLKPIGDAVEFAIVSFDDEHETIVHAEGRLAFREGWTGPAFAAERVSLQALRERATRREDGAAWYERFREHDFEYGPAFRSVRELFVGDGFALSRLRIDERLKSDYGRFVLHPSMIDGALQTVAGLVAGDAGDAMSPHVPFALDEVEIAHPIPQQCYALATFAEGGDAGRAGIRRFDILLLNEDGDVLVAMRNLYVRALVAPAAGRRSPAVA